MKASVVIFLAVLFQYSCGNAINPLIAPLARETGISEVQSGLFFTLSSLMWLIASPYWGRQSESVGRKRVMLIGLGSCSLLYMLFALIGSWGLSYHPAALLLFILLLLTRIASGLFFSTVPVAAQAYIADTTQGKERTSALTLVWIGSGLGSIIGPSLGIVSSYGFMTPLYVAAILPLTGFILVWTQLPSTKKKNTLVNTRKYQKVRPFDKRIWPFLLLITALQATILSMQVTTGFFVKDQFHFSLSEAAKVIGLIFMFSGIASITSQLVFVRTLKLSASRLLIIGTSLILLSFTSLFFHTHMTALYVTFTLLGLGIGLVLPGATSGASLSVSASEQGATAGLITAAQGLGTLSGPIIGTSLYPIHSLYPYLATSGLFLIASIIIWIKVSERHVDDNKGVSLN